MNTRDIWSRQLAAKYAAEAEVQQSSPPPPAKPATTATLRARDVWNAQLNRTALPAAPAMTPPAKPAVAASSSSEVAARIKRDTDFIRQNQQAAAAAMKRAKARALDAERRFSRRTK